MMTETLMIMSFTYGQSDVAKQFIKDFKSVHPNLKCGLIVKINPHDFGPYLTVESIWHLDGTPYNPTVVDEEEYEDAIKCESEYLENVLDKFPDWQEYL